MSQNDLMHLNSHFQQWKTARGNALPPKLDPLNDYSIFASTAYRTSTAKWLFPEEKATLKNAAMLISEAKML
ncbi:MAG TPA: hypothetical protein VMA34_19485 [Terracidiphilus sp.]|nr:hypothetical protein [Terracidiphilus sp.]